jgi:hypothetical protein
MKSKVTPNPIAHKPEATIEARPLKSLRPLRSMNAIKSLRPKSVPMVANGILRKQQ